MMARPFCLYMLAHHGNFAGDFANPSRLFDLVVNDWTGDARYSKAAQLAEYRFAEKGRKGKPSPG